MKRLLLLVMSVAALSLNAQVYTEYFTEADNGTVFNAGDAIETGDAGADPANYDGWYLNAKTSNREVGANGEASPLISSEDALFYAGYKGSLQGQPVSIDSAVAYSSDQRSTNWIVNNGTDTLKLGAQGTAIYAATLFQPLPNSKASERDFFGFEWSATSNSSRGRIIYRPIGSDCFFAVSNNKSKTADGAVPTDTIVDGVGKTYLLVLKYVPGDPNVEKDDHVVLYVNPDPALSEEAQTGYVLTSVDAQSDKSEGTVVRLNIRQRGINGLFSGIRAGTNWEEVLLGSAATGVELDQTTLALGAGESALLTATVLPEGDAQDPTVSWSTSDDQVATVNNGIVAAVGAGTATITATSTDGGFTADCEVTVAASALSNSSLTEVSLYPNPSNGVFTIANQAGANVRIVNVTGKVVYEKQNIEELEQINTELSKGLYFVAVEAGKTQIVTKLVIE